VLSAPVQDVKSAAWVLLKTKTLLVSPAVVILVVNKTNARQMDVSVAQRDITLMDPSASPAPKL
jgi:hypothetical protein